MIKSVIIAVIGLIVVIGIFMLLRNFFSWYKKTNEQIKLVKETNKNLERVISRLDTMLKIQKLNKETK